MLLKNNFVLGYLMYNKSSGERQAYHIEFFTGYAAKEFKLVMKGLTETKVQLFQFSMEMEHSACKFQTCDLFLHRTVFHMHDTSSKDSATTGNY